MSRLVIEDLSVARGKRPVLEGVGLSASAGRVTAIVGPNGSGKSTLLGAVTGDLPFEGRIALNGRDIAAASSSELAAQRGVLSQSQGLAFPFTVIEVVRMGLLAGPHGNRSEIAVQALERVGLAHKAGDTFHVLSGGEQQRAHLARVLAQVWTPVRDGVPCWLFLDEPVSSLDIAHQIEVMEIASDFAAAGGGVVAVMHDLNLTAMYAHHVVVLNEGRVQAAGPPPAVFTDAILSEVYRCPIRVGAAPPDGSVFILPHGAVAPGAFPRRTSR